MTVELREYQKVGIEFLYERKSAGLFDEMGCVSYDTEIPINRGGYLRKYTIEDAYFAFNSLNNNKGHNWRPEIETYTRSLCNGILRLNRVKAILYSGIKEVIELKFYSGKIIRLTEDHEIAIPGEEWLAAGQLNIGSEVVGNGIGICSECNSAKNLIEKITSNYYGMCFSCMHKIVNIRGDGRFIDKDGYVRLRMPTHPRANRSGHVYEHMVVMEKEIGRYLKWPEEHIHHINEDKSDNRLENLELLSPKDHLNRHEAYLRLNGGSTINGGIVNFIPIVEVVESINFVGEVPTYDIVVEDPHRNFVANGIVVHNCGKTRQALATIERIGTTKNLVVAPKIVARHWTREIEKVFGPTYTTFIEDPIKKLEYFNEGNAGAFVALGTPKERKEALLAYQLFQNKFPDRPSFLITNYHNLSDLRPDFSTWGIRIMDEAHAIKNHETEFWKLVRKFNVLRDYMLTGTPMSQGPKDLWAYLNIIDRKAWPSYHRYVRENLRVYESKSLGNKIGGPINPKLLRDMMEPYIIRRLKKDVLPQLKKSRIIYDVSPTTKQQKVYKELSTDLLSESDNGDLLIIENGAVKSVRLRQLLVAPQILGFTFSSATLSAVTEIVTSCGTPSAIFTTFREAFPFIRASLPKTWEVYEVSGGMSYEELDRVVQAYEKSSTDKKTIIATTQMSQGYELLCASNCIFAGLDWSPSFNLQSEDRLSRLGNHNHVTCHYVINVGTVEVGMVKRNEEKMMWGAQSIRPGELTL